MMEVLLILGGIVVAIWVAEVMRRGKESQAAQQVARAQQAVQRERCRLETEKRAIELMIEFPALFDGDIATLLRDELVNSGNATAPWLEWATEDTVSRVRRTAAVLALRRQREEKLKG